MNATGLEVFDSTIQETNIWLKDLMEQLGGDRHKAYQALRAVLHALRDRLTVEEAAEFGAQLPMLIQRDLKEIDRAFPPPHRKVPLATN